jgi:hypothetical protein
MLTESQIALFHEQGYLIMRGLIAEQELGLLRESVDQVQAEGLAHLGAHHLYHTQPDGTQVYWQSGGLWQRGDAFLAVTVNPDLLENIGQCLGQAFFPWNDSMVVKLPSAGAPVAWHQDPPYGYVERTATYPVPNFTTDIYLDRSTVSNGCVWALPGRHLVGHVDLDSRRPEQLYQNGAAIPLEMEPGDVLFHCLSAPHGSPANSSDTQRRVMYIHYLAQEVYDDGYAAEPWAKDKPGWNDDRRRLLETMLDRRAALGLESPTRRSTLRFGQAGIEFVGAPVTPRRHWAKLASAIPPAQFAALKSLADIPA